MRDNRLAHRRFKTDITTQVTWASSNVSVAAIGPAGLAGGNVCNTIVGAKGCTWMDVITGAPVVNVTVPVTESEDALIVAFEPSTAFFGTFAKPVLMLPETAAMVTTAVLLLDHATVRSRVRDPSLAQLNVPED